jgi:hypothetical protein
VGQFIATLGAENKVVMKKVEIARDMGNVVQIASGLSIDDEIIDVPPDSLESGDIVRPLAKNTKP